MHADEPDVDLYLPPVHSAHSPPLLPVYDDDDDDISMYIYIYICMYICIYAYTCHRCSLRAEKGERKWGKGESGERDLELVHTKIHAKHKDRGGRSRACAYIYKRREI